MYDTETGLISSISYDNINNECIEGNSCLEIDDNEINLDLLSCYKIINNKLTIDDTLNKERFLVTTRILRNNLLSSSDFSQLPDSPLTEEQKQAWAEYRQQLRDYPSTIVDPLNPPPFPTKPS